jgi:hypothetical protein
LAIPFGQTATMSSFTRKPSPAGQALPLLALVATWLLMHASLVVFRDLPVFEAGLLGPDSYMRMLRITELYEGWNWFDGTIARANAPFGDTLHWTRPFDILVMLLALPAALVVSYPEALFFAGVVVSPLLQLTTGLAAIWALRPLIRPGIWFLPVIALFLQPGALAYSILGRADHHSLLLLIFVVVAGFVLRALRNPLDARPALLAGVATGFGIWLSVEFLLVMGLCLIALGLPWLFGERDRAGQNKWFALAVSCVVLLALFAERPFAELLDASYDRVSGVQFFVAVCILLFWEGIEHLDLRVGAAGHFTGRASLAIIGVGITALLVNTIYPVFFAGPMAGVDPRIQAIWLDRVVEMQDAIPRDRYSLGSFVFYLGGGLLVLPFFLKVLADARGRSDFWPLCFVLLACLLLSLAAVRHMRFSGYAEIAFVFAFAVLLERFLDWTYSISSDLLRGLLRGSFVSAMLLGPVLLGNLLMSERAEATDAAGQSLLGCDVGQVADYLEQEPRWSARPQTILTFLDIGPELLYRTRHAVIGTPYHRNGDGIYDSHRMMTTPDEAQAREMIERRRVDLVLLCETPGERLFFTGDNGGPGLYQRLAEGRPPAWLAPVELPAALGRQARLFAVVR